ncbi:MAG: isoaspartyl peptidase/L-asparaginase [Chitinophagaceae bacterium]|nr:isoaspartyl peptidase/L-asparaginase [Chitinophagaceae bacterium]
MAFVKIVIHGGAGTIRKTEMTEHLEERYREGLAEALEAGYQKLEKGCSAVEAVMASVMSLEDNELFNAGKGSVFTSEGVHEMDAAIMDGASLKAGAVCAVSRIKNPVRLAYMVMNHSPHVMLCGKGAETFARMHQLPEENDEYFFSEYRYEQWKMLRNTDQSALDHNVHLSELRGSSRNMTDKKYGTVGAVAIDSHGNLAAATSTGGMTNKRWGRIGDSPVIGAGTYANNNTCAISCTGHGEIFLRTVAAYDVSCLMEYKRLSLQEAMRSVVFDKLQSLQGEGGMIGLDASGNHAMIFNSEGMYRGVKGSDGSYEIAIYA